MLTAGEIAQMRSVIDDALPGTAIISRRTLTTDSQGGSEEAWANIGTVSCRWSPIASIASDVELDQSARVAALKERVVTVPANTTVNQTDRLSIGGTVHAITGIAAPRDWELSRRISCVEVD
jgi:head-tail adaptor